MHRIIEKVVGHHQIIDLNYNEMLPIYVCGRKHVIGQASV
jgi:hypothetical protein